MVYSRDHPTLPSELAGITPATFAERADGNLAAAVGPATTQIRQAMQAVLAPKRTWASRRSHSSPPPRLLVAPATPRTRGTPALGNPRTKVGRPAARRRSAVAPLTGVPSYCHPGFSDNHG